MRQRGSFFLGWARMRLGWLVSYVVTCAIFIVVWLLTHGSIGDAVYGCIVSAALLALAAVVDGLRVYAQHQALKNALERVDELEQAPPDGMDFVQRQYAALCAALLQRARRETAQREARHSESRDYYTLWAHQIKTPIAALRLLCDEPEAVCELHKLERYADMALQYVRAEDIAGDLRPERVNIGDVVRACVRKYAVLFVGKNLIAQVDIDRVYAVTDSKWLAFIVEQLLSNAVKYTDHGCVSVYMDGNGLCVRDTGCGVRPEDLPRVFERGYTGACGRLDTRATGLGLYLSRKVAHSLGASLSLESDYGHGTTARLSLPMENALPRE